MKRKFIISEIEKKEIKELYNLTEQEDGIRQLFQAGLEKLKAQLAGKENETEDEFEDEIDNEDTSGKITGDVGSAWMDITKKIIDKFEGGYWNYWECKNHPYTPLYDKSGETMFGLDRKAGNIENAFGSDGKEFFAIIDDEKKRLGMNEFCKKWKYNYKAEGSTKDRLIELAGKIMKRAYDDYSSRYFKGDTRKRVEGNRGLLLHFAYACWNGPGFFKGFANSINKAVEEGKSDRELLNIAKEDRRQRLSGGWAQATEKVNREIDSESGMA